MADKIYPVIDVACPCVASQSFETFFIIISVSIIALLVTLLFLIVKGR